MRTIIFKGKRPENGEWVYGSFYEDGGVAYMFGRCFDESLAKNVAFSVDRETVCQFTGFMDKNYKNVYEGDVLRLDLPEFREKISYCGSVTVRDNFYGVVRWFADYGSFCIVRCPNLTVGECYDHDKVCFALCDERLQVSEVVGNIHETEWKQYGEYFQEVFEKEVRND